jgi:hypothetical protein
MIARGLVRCPASGGEGNREALPADLSGFASANRAGEISSAGTEFFLGRSSVRPLRWIACYC